MALGASAGCGSDAGQRDGDGAVAAATRDDDPAVSGGAQAQVAEAIADVQDSLVSADGGLCFELADADVDRLAARARRPSGDCFGAVAAMIERRRELGIEAVRSRVLSVTVKGGYAAPRRATAVVADGGGRPYRVRLVDAAGEWKLIRFRPDTPSGLGAPAGEAER